MSDFTERVIDEFRANGGWVETAGFGDSLVLVHSIGARTGIERVSPEMGIRMPTAGSLPRRRPALPTTQAGITTWPRILERRQRWRSMMLFLRCQSSLSNSSGRNATKPGAGSPRGHPVSPLTRRRPTTARFRVQTSAPLSAAGRRLERRNLVRRVTRAEKLRYRGTIHRNRWR